MSLNCNVDNIEGNGKGFVYHEVLALSYSKYEEHRKVNPCQSLVSLQIQVTSQCFLLVHYLMITSHFSLHVCETLLKVFTSCMINSLLTFPTIKDLFFLGHMWLHQETHQGVGVRLVLSICEFFSFEQFSSG